MKKTIRVLFTSLLLAGMITSVANAKVKKVSCGPHTYMYFKTSNKTLYLSGRGATDDFGGSRDWLEGKKKICNAKDVKRIVVEKNITKIGEGVFAGLPRATSVKFKGTSLKSIDKLAFSESGIKTITIPKGVKEISGNTFYDCKKLTSIKVVSGNKYFSSKNGVLFDKKKKTLIAYPGGKKGKAYTVPASVKVIGEESFNFNTKLTKLTLPKNITEIERSAFNTANIKTYYFPGKRPYMQKRFPVFNVSKAITIYYKAQNWEEDDLLNYGAKKVTWKKY